MIVIAGTARILPDQRDAGAAAIRTMAAASNTEPGCRQYRFAVDLDDENLVHVFEEWDSPEALDEHFASPHMADFRAALGGVVDGPPDLARFEVTSKGPLL